MDHSTGNDAAGPIIVGIDGSENSGRAFDVAMSLARERQRGLKVIAAYTDPGFGTVPDAGVVAREQAQLTLDTFAGQIEDADVEVSSEVIEGDAAGALVSDSQRASFVVVGKRGRSRFAGRLLGSVSGSLAAHSRCPTLIVPERQEAQQPPEVQLGQRSGRPEWAEIGVFVSDESDDVTDFTDCVVVGVDLDARPVEVALQGAEWAQRRGLTLMLVTAQPFGSNMWGPGSPMYGAAIPDLRKNTARRLATVAEGVAAQTEVPVEWRFFDASAPDALSDASKTAALLVLGTRGHGGFAGLLLGSVSQAVLNRAISPVLVIPTKTDK